MSDETTQPIGGEAEQPAGGAEARFTQSDLDRVDAKNRRKLNELKAQLDQLQAKESERAEAAKTAEEKRIEAAIKAKETEMEQHYTARITAKEIDAELRVRLIQGGYDPDLAHVVKAKGEIASVDDIPDAINAAMAGKEWAKVRIPHQAGTPTGPSKDGTPRTLEEYNAFVEANGVKAVTPEIYERMKALLRK